MKNKKAFTLVEMLIVVVIIWILAAALIPRLVWAQSQARDVARKKWMNDLMAWLEVYYNNEWTYYFWQYFWSDDWLYRYWCVKEWLWNILISWNIMSNLPLDPQNNRKHYGRNSYSYTQMPIVWQPSSFVWWAHRSINDNYCIWSFVYLVLWINSWEANSFSWNAYVISANMENEKNNNLVLPPTINDINYDDVWSQKWYFYQWFWSANLNYYTSKICNKWIKITSNISDPICQTTDPNKAVNAIFTIK